MRRRVAKRRLAKPAWQRGGELGVTLVLAAALWGAVSRRRGVSGGEGPPLGTVGVVGLQRDNGRCLAPIPGLR